MGLLLAFDAVAWEWAYSEEELKNNVGALMCAPEVQRQTLQNTVNTVGVLLESEIFDGQDQLRKRFATIAQMKNDSPSAGCLPRLGGGVLSERGGVDDRIEPLCRGQELWQLYRCHREQCGRHSDPCATTGNLRGV